MLYENMIKIMFVIYGMTCGITTQFPTETDQEHIKADCMKRIKSTGSSTY